MQILKEINSPFIYEITLPGNIILTPVIELVEMVNVTAEKYKFKCVEFDALHQKITIEYTAKETFGVGCYAAMSRSGQNKEMEQAIYKLVCLCNVLKDPTPEFTLRDHRRLSCQPIDHIASLRIDDSDLFYDNVNFFKDKAEKILSDSKNFLTPVYCGKHSFFSGIPTLGIFTEFWIECQIQSAVVDNLPICKILGNPMTGSNGCKAINRKGEIVKAQLNVAFTDLLSMFGKINSRYRHVKDVCKSYSLEEVINQLNNH